MTLTEQLGQYPSPNHLPDEATRIGFIGTAIAGFPDACAPEIPADMLFQRLSRLQSIPASERMTP